MTQPVELTNSRRRRGKKQKKKKKTLRRKQWNQFGLRDWLEFGIYNLLP